MRYFIKRSRFRLGFLFILCFLLVLFCSPAHAWKLKTHAYIANIVMDDAKDGKVWIPPYGEFEVRAEVADAMKNCPDFFRGGSIGPDGFPDMWTGQAYIHPDTDPWLRHLWNFLATYKINMAIRAGNAREQAVAFTFGYFSHCAGDMWAHDWVNTYAGGVFPSLKEMKAHPTDNIPIAVRHIAIENTLDKRIPLGVKTIDVPNDFLAEAMVLNRNAQSAGMNPVINYYVDKYFEKLPHKDEVQSPTFSSSDGGIYVGSGMRAPIKTYDAFWFDDLERGFKSTDAKIPGWIEANKRALKDVMEKDKGMLSALGEYLGLWAVTYMMDMAGAPSISRNIGEDIATNKARAESILSTFGFGENERKNLKDSFVEILLQKTMGISKATFDQIWSAEVTAQLFSAAHTSEIMVEIGNPPSEDTWKNAWNNQSNLNTLLNSINGPLYNSVITSKLCLLKPSELERLLGGKKLPAPMGQVVIIGAIKGIDYSRQFTKPDGLIANWLGYGLNLDAVSPIFGKPIFPYIFKSYRPIDNTRAGVWSILDKDHRWGGKWPMTKDMEPPLLSNIVISQFNSETVRVVFDSNEILGSAMLEYQTSSLQNKTIPWVTGQSLHGEQGASYELNIHEMGMSVGAYKIKIKAKDPTGNEIQTDWMNFVLFGESTWEFKATPGANNTIVLTWKKYPRAGEFQKYVLGKGSQIPTQSSTVHATSYDADQMPQRGFQPIEITNINTTTKTIPASQLTNLTITARSKRGNFLTKPTAPVVQSTQTSTSSSTTSPATQSQTTTSTSTQTTTGTGTRPRTTGRATYQ